MRSSHAQTPFDAFRRRCCFALGSAASLLGVSVRALTHLNDEANPQQQPQVDVRVACDRHGSPTDAPAVLVIQDLDDVFERHYVELRARSTVGRRRAVSIKQVAKLQHAVKLLTPLVCQVNSIDACSMHQLCVGSAKVVVLLPTLGQSHN